MTANAATPPPEHEAERVDAGSTSRKPAALQVTPAEPSNSVLPLVAAALVSGGLVMFALLMIRDAPVPEAAAAEAPVARAGAAASAPTIVAPKWKDNRAMWLANQRRGVAYDVEAESKISVWTRTVRPSLVVRCSHGITEVFVVTHSAAHIEPQTENHTVTFSFDSGGETSEAWPDSSEHDALFAPDGPAFARRLLSAKWLRFAFTPHNAPRAAMRFYVDGLEQARAAAATECGWKK